MSSKKSVRKIYDDGIEIVEPFLPFDEIPLASPPSEPAMGEPQDRLNPDLIWLSPMELTEHPENKTLFGEERLNDLIDLIEVIESFGFDPTYPIEVTNGDDDSYIVVDGHRRRLAALRLGLEQVPVIVKKYDGEDETRDQMIRAKMIRANVVDGKQQSKIGIATSVRLVQELERWFKKRGRPAKNENEFANEPNLNREPDRDKFYARKLNISEKKFKCINYILKRGTEKEIRDLDTQARTYTAVHRDVKTRVDGEKKCARLEPNCSPKEVFAKTRSCARSINELFKLIENVSFDDSKLDEEIHLLNLLAEQESKGAAKAGETAAAATALLRSLTVLSSHAKSL